MPINAINQFIARYQNHALSDQEKIELADQVLEKMSALNADSNPIHYTVLYESIARTDHEFADKVEKSILTKKYSNKKAEELFLELISTYLYEHLPTYQVEELLKTLLKQIKLWIESSEENEKQILNGVQHISEIDGMPQAIKETFDSEIIPAIHALIDNTHALKSEATDANQEVEKLKLELEQATLIAKTDELTRIPNRRGFNEKFEQMVERCTEDEEFGFSMIIIDIDFFKAINDEFGHLIGDSVLRYLSKLLQQETKGKDFIARIGGEEFVLLLPRTNHAQALSVAENLRAKVQKTRLHVTTHKKDLTLTISSGVSTFQTNDTLETMMDRADKALYSAKNTGRNNVKGEADIA